MEIGHPKQAIIEANKMMAVPIGVVRFSVVEIKCLMVNVMENELIFYPVLALNI